MSSPYGKEQPCCVLHVRATQKCCRAGTCVICSARRPGKRSKDTRIDQAAKPGEYFSKRLQNEQRKREEVARLEDGVPSQMRRLLGAILIKDTVPITRGTMR